MSRPNILVVDDDKDFLHSVRDYLEVEPYYYNVFIALDEEEALEQCQKEIVHAAVIDIVLHKNQDDDRSGLELAKKLDSSIAKVILTGWSHFDMSELIMKILGPDEGELNADGFVRKGQDPDELAKKIKSALNRMRLNLNLEIVMEKPFDWHMLVNQIKIFREKSDIEKEKATEVLKDLTRRLFKSADAVRFLRITAGHSSCAVVMAQPTERKASGEIWAVKFGPRGIIDKEVENYRKYVEPLAGIRSTRLMEGGAVYSREMAAIAYKYIGDEEESVRDFAAYFKQPRVGVEKLSKTIDYLFKTTCKRWYENENIRVPDEDEKVPLDQFYRNQLNMLEVDHLRELETKFSGLLAVKPHGQEFKLQDQGMLRVDIERRNVLTLPNPITFAFSDKSSLSGSDFFGPPTKLAITHGDLHASNILVSKAGNTWLIDFYKTGWGPALRDFAELESDIKFDRLESNSLRVRYDLEQMLLSPTTLMPKEGFTSTLGTQASSLTRVATTIKRLRELASELTDTEDLREYYTGLLFYALKRIAGFTSASGIQEKNVIAQYHAILSAALICDKLALLNASKNGAVFLAYPYQAHLHKRLRSSLKEFLSERDYQVFHPLDDPSNGQLWPRTAEMLRSTTANLCEISAVNGNVMFELGYTIGIRKPYLLLYKGNANGHSLPSLLSGELRINYHTNDDLGHLVVAALEKVKKASVKYFFEEQRFKHSVRRAKVSNKLAYLITANTHHQHETVEPLLQAALEAMRWKVETIPLEQELSLGDFYLRLLRAELIVGCFASKLSARLSKANAELALALGIACGAGKDVIILQNKRGKILVNTTFLTKTFDGMRDAVRVLKAELKKRATRRTQHKALH